MPLKLWMIREGYTRPETDQEGLEGEVGGPEELEGEAGDVRRAAQRGHDHGGVLLADRELAAERGEHRGNNREPGWKEASEQLSGASTPPRKRI